MKISVSQIKKYMKSPAEWAGTYILGIKDEWSNDAVSIWKAIHYYLETWDKFGMYNVLEVEDTGKAVEQLDILIDNIEKFDIPKWEHEVMVDADLLGLPAVWYVDLLTDDEVIDFKTVSKLSKPDDKPWTWQAVNNYEEYKLQMWYYMKATGRKKARILELMKKRFKTKEVNGQWIEFEWSDEFDKEMINKYWPIVLEMQDLYNKHK